MLPRYFFGRCKYLSFTRKLYRWGFRQADKALVNTNVFKNPDFIRGVRSKCSNMKSTVVKRQTPPSSPDPSSPNPGGGRRRRGRGGSRAGRQQDRGGRGGAAAASGGDLPGQMAPGQIFSYPTASGEMVPMMMLPMPVAAWMMMSGGADNMPPGVRSYMEQMMAGVGSGGDGGGMPFGSMRDMPGMPGMPGMRDMPSMRDMQSQMMRNQMMGGGSTMGGFLSSGFPSRHGDGGGGDVGGPMMRGMAGMHGSDMGDRDGMRQDMGQGGGGRGDDIDSLLLKRASLNRLRETSGGISGSGAFDRFGGPGPSMSQQHDSMRGFGYSARQYDQLGGGSGGIGSPGAMYNSRMMPDGRSAGERRQMPEAYDDRDAVEIMRRLRNEYTQGQGYQSNYMSNQGFGSPSRTNQDRQGYSGRDQRDHSSGQSTGFGSSSHSMGGQDHRQQDRR